MGQETTAPHNRTKTQHQRTIDWTKNILINFKTYKDHFTNSLMYI